jgi:hypothetical protein
MRSFQMLRHRTFVTAGLFMVILLWSAGFSPGCSSSVDVSLNLIGPCSDPGLLSEMGCQYIRINVSSLDPLDPLFGEPLRATCAMNQGKCSLGDAEILGQGRIVDALCLLSENGAPVGRATTGSLRMSKGGVGGDTLNLEIGKIYSFIDTTVLDGEGDAGACSPMEQAGGRVGQAATLLQDGRVFITGGMRRLAPQQEDVLSTAEIYDPTLGTHRLILDKSGNPLKMMAPSGRAYHTATTLRDGKVLIAGGVGLLAEGNNFVKRPLQSAELFDPEKGIFLSSSIIGVERAHHTATLLTTGEVLVTGGASYTSGVISGYNDTADLYDPVTNSWQRISGKMAVARAFHQAVLLDPETARGSVLVVGGENEAGPVKSMDIYDPQMKKFNAAVSMSKKRSHHCSVLLSDGNVLIAGGVTEGGAVDSGVEVYIPLEGGSGSFKPDVVNMSVSRRDHTCSLLQNGNVLVFGGAKGPGQMAADTDLIQVGTSISVTRLTEAELNPPRIGHSAAVLDNGWVLVTGGLPDETTSSLSLSQGMLFVPPPVVW